MLKALTAIILCFTAGAMLAHALFQPLHNEVARAEAEEEAYRQGAVIGWVRMDRVSKQLYFVENEP